MKKILFVALALILLGSYNAIKAAPVWNMPAIRIQPNGDTLHCFITGDEFYQRLHDAEGYTIVQHPQTGYWVYAISKNGQLTASDHVAGQSNPTNLGIEPNLTISYPELMERKRAWDIPSEFMPNIPKTKSYLNAINNIMIFIRFADDTIYTEPLVSVDRMLNDSSEDAVSMYNYFRHASYGKLKLITHYYPTPNGQDILSYQDIYNRSYYRPYNASSNPDGYQNEYQRSQREFNLIERATNYINSNSPVDSTLNLDCDNDGMIDNICYVVKGSYTGWADLLWPHKWNLYDRELYINGKRVWTFNFMLAGAGSHYFGPSTFCHEMTHTLSAPDLYHYYNFTEVHPAGQWDLMEQNTQPPQHTSAWIKYKYCGWIDSIPTVSEQGTYAMASIDHATNNCWKIPSSDPNQFYLVEYRNKQSDIFESGLPGSGMIIARIDTRFDGNASFDKMYQFDELYIFRPDGNDSVDGSPNMANFSPYSGNTTFNSRTNPAPMLTGNIPDTTFSLNNIHIVGDSLYFDYILMTGCRMPLDLNATNVTGSSATLTWDGISDSYIVEWGKDDGSQIETRNTLEAKLDIWGLTKNEDYKFRVRSYCGDSDSSVFSDWKYFKAGPCYSAINLEIGSGASSENTLPFCPGFRYSYTQQIFSSIELAHKELSINKLAFYYNSSNALSGKSNCRIYLGYVNRSTFESQTDMVPLDSLTLVYSGPMNFTKGWNSITLDNDFIYDGMHNIVVAVDDNSAAGGSNGKFRVTNGTYYNAISYYSDSENPDPADPTNFVGIMARKKFRSNIRFEGCNANGEDSDVSIENVDETAPTIYTSHLMITVETEQQSLIKLYDITGRMISNCEGNTIVNLRVPQAGVYILLVDGNAHKVVVM